jgi:hypothetical protein
MPTRHVLRGDYSDTARTENSMNLGNEVVSIGKMLDNLIRENNIERLGFEWEPLFQIGRDRIYAEVASGYPRRLMLLYGTNVPPNERCGNFERHMTVAAAEIENIARRVRICELARHIANVQRVRLHEQLRPELTKYFQALRQVVYPRGETSRSAMNYDRFALQAAQILRDNQSPCIRRMFGVRRQIFASIAVTRRSWLSKR